MQGIDVTPAMVTEVQLHKYIMPVYVVEQLVLCLLMEKKDLQL